MSQNAIALTSPESPHLQIFKETKYPFADRDVQKRTGQANTTHLRIGEIHWAVLCGRVVVGSGYSTGSFAL
jgi:hypothetical protein